MQNLLQQVSKLKTIISSKPRIEFLRYRQMIIKQYGTLRWNFLMEKCNECTSKD